VDLYALGASYPDGAPLFAEVALEDLIDRLPEVTGDARRVAAAPWIFDEIRPVAQPRLDHPEEAGWAYVVCDGDPQRDSITGKLEPLATRRGRTEPLEFPAGADRGDWIDEIYRGMGDKRPRYVLLAGDPTQLPYQLQVDLAAAGAMVGRVCFPDPEDYGTYAAKLERFDGGDPVPTLNATVVSTFGGITDATVFSSRFLIPPVTTLLNASGFTVHPVTDKAATKDGITAELLAERRAIVFTASHGAGRRDGDPRAVNGAWGCAPADPAAPANRWDWLTAADLPSGAVAPGGLVVQFACFGYGTTDHTSFAAWLGNSTVIEASEPFVAAIPQKLLANPDGPLGYVGHVDYALAHGFVDPYGPSPANSTHPRVQPFLSLITKAVVELAPIGLALRDLHERSASLASELTSTFDTLAQQGVKPTDLDEAEKKTLVDKVIRRNDAMHFLLFGDPAARVRIDG
jgi:hypothetical protein